MQRRSDVVNHDPHIFLAPLAIQLKKLILKPLNHLAPCSITPYVIILDGLDETLLPDNQQLVLNVISETLYPLSLRLFPDDGLTLKNRTYPDCQAMHSNVLGCPF